MGTPAGVDGEVHATRRSGARHEVSTRVTLKALGGPSRAAGALLEGWALNVSKGGIRVILEEKVEPGEEFDVELLDPNAAAGGEGPAIEGAQAGCVVWVQEESDGVVAGIAFKKC
jgi:hypothetical protein